MVREQKAMLVAGACALASVACSGAYRELDSEIEAAAAAGAAQVRDTAQRAPTAAMPGAPAAGVGGGAGAVAPPMGAAPAAPSAPASVVRRAASVDGLALPSGVAVDTASGTFYIAGGEGSEAYVIRVDSMGRRMEQKFVAPNGAPRAAKGARRPAAGAAAGTTLGAPRGLALVADTLWVADVTALRAFNRLSGRLMATVNLAPEGATMLTDVAVGPDGALYVTDGAVKYTTRGVAQATGKDRIFRVAGRTVTVALATPRLAMPSAIAWDRRRDRFLVAPMGSDTIFAWRPGTETLEPIASGTGQWEGIVATEQGAFLATSRASQAVFRFDGSFGTRLIELPRAGGDLALDARRGRLAVAVPSEGRVEIWAAPR